WFANLDGYVFVRPDSGRKTFTGQTIGYGEHHYRCNLIDQHSSVHDTTLILVSKAQQINTEFRYFIVQNQVVASSLYQWGDLGTPRQDEFYVTPVDLKPQ